MKSEIIENLTSALLKYLSQRQLRTGLALFLHASQCFHSNLSFLVPSFQAEAEPPKLSLTNQDQNHQILVPSCHRYLEKFSFLVLLNRKHLNCYGRSFAIKMSSDSLPSPESGIVVGFGGAAVDFLAAVAAFPKPDQKIRSTDLKVQGGGNVGNALTCAARLGLKPRIISKVANDTQGRAVVEELEADGVDTSFFVVSKGGNSPFTYVIVDSQTGKLNQKVNKNLHPAVVLVTYFHVRKTRTCIHTPGYPPMIPEDLSRASLLSALDGARLVYFDARMHETALVIAEEAFQKNIPILVDAERPREGLNDLLKLADYVICSEKFPQAWTEASSIPRALVSILLRLPRIKFVIITLGKNGCIMLDRCVNEGPQIKEADVDTSLESLAMGKDDTIATPTCITSSLMKFRAEGIGTVCGKLYIATAEKIPPSELIDTTGAGDAFVGAVLYAICANFSPEKMLPFASCVAAANCKALGARSGLPCRTDPCLASFFDTGASGQ